MVVLQSLVGLFVIIISVVLACLLLGGIVYIDAYIDEYFKRNKVYSIIIKFIKKSLNIIFNIIIVLIFTLALISGCYQIGSGILK